VHGVVLNEERKSTVLGWTARALLEARGVELSAREAQQEQQAAAQEGGRERAGDGRMAAHSGTLAENGVPRNGAGRSGVRNCALPKRWP